MYGLKKSVNLYHVEFEHFLKKKKMYNLNCIIVIIFIVLIYIHGATH